jgi:hypothetical protein
MRVAVLSPLTRPAGLTLPALGGASTDHDEWEADATRVPPFSESSTPEPDPPQDASSATGSAPPARSDASPTWPSMPGPGVSALRLRVVLVAALLVALAVAAASLIPGNHPKGAIAQRPAPTATATQAPTPTPTLTATPGLALMPGFAVYQDPASGYALQYPEVWPKPSTDPNLGVQFSDSSNLDSARYVVQVNEPDPLTSGVATGPDPNTAAANWVNFELTNFQQTEEAHGFTFTREPGPIPSVLIGGQQWQAGAAVISGQNLTLQVHVYATIHTGKPYVINLLAAASVFATGQQTYFAPMLNSFQFATPGS